MKEETLAGCLAQLSNVTRLKIYRILISSKDSMKVGDIQKKLNIPASTLSHHISKLVVSKLVFQKRDGRILYCSPNFKMLDDILEALKNQCCVDKCSS